MNPCPSSVFWKAPSRTAGGTTSPPDLILNGATGNPGAANNCGIMLSLTVHYKTHVFWINVFLFCITFLISKPHFTMRLLSATGNLATANFIVGVFSTPFVSDSRRHVSYQGITSSPGVETFLGIPYGKDTSGMRRFASPEAFIPPPGYIFNATTPGASCPQQSGGGFKYSTNVTYLSENCLNLLLARPANMKGRKLPVIAYIYGGDSFLIHRK